MTTGQSSGSSRTNEPSATDHQDAVVVAAYLRELGTTTGEARGKGKKWKHSEKVLERRSG